MSAEQQILDFVFRMQTTQFRKETDKLILYFEKLENKADNVFKKNIAKAGLLAAKGLGVLNTVIETSINDWIQHTLRMEHFRKEAGLSQKEIAEFSSSIISASAKYGVALNSVSMMATVLGKGLGRTRLEAVKVAAAMKDFGDVTGIADETATQLANTLFRQFNSSAEDTIKLTANLVAQTRAAHVSFDEVAKILGRNADAMRILPIKESTRELGALTAALLEQGATAEQTEGVISQFGNVNSRVYKAFIASGKNVQATMKVVTDRVKGLREQVRQGTIDHTQYEVNLNSLGEAFNLSKFQVEKMADSVDNMGDKLKAFDDTDKLSVEQIRKSNLEKATAFTKLGKQLETVHASVSKGLESLYGPNAPIWGFVSDLMPSFLEGIETIGKSITVAAAAVGEFFVGFYGYLEKGMTLWTEFSNAIGLSGSKDHVSSGHAGKNAEEKVAFMRRQFETIANRMEAKGADKETVSRFKTERTADLQKFASSQGVTNYSAGSLAQGVPPSQAPGGSSDNSVAMANVKATQAVGQKLDRVAQLLEDGQRQDGVNRIRTDSNPSRAALMATRTVTQ